MDIDPNLVGLAHGMGSNLRKAQRNTQEWIDAYYNMEAQRNAVANENQRLKDEIADLTDRLAVSQATIEGLKGVINGFKETHPDSPLMEPAKPFSQPQFASVPRKKYHDLYDQAFDAKAKEMGISDPVERRPH